MPLTFTFICDFKKTCMLLAFVFIFGLKMIYIAKAKDDLYMPLAFMFIYDLKMICMPLTFMFICDFKKTCMLLAFMFIFGLKMIYIAKAIYNLYMPLALC